mgnify:CR=1 FL=1
MIGTAVGSDYDLIESLLDTDRHIGKHEELTRQRILNAHKTWPDKGYYFDMDAGERVITFVEGYCKHFKGEWATKPMLLENWQKVIILEAFGWMRPDGFRLHRTLWLELARKNGKSQLAAALGVYLLIADGEPGSEVYSSATKRDQAKIVFDCATQIVKQSKHLSTYIKTQRANLSVLRTASKFEPLSSEGDTLDGLNPHGNIVDELHSHRDRKVWDTLITAQGARRQPMNILITTAGIYDPAQIGFQLHDHAIAILENKVTDDSWCVWISASDEKDDPYSIDTWEKANPNLGISIYPNFLEQRAGEALSQPSSMNAFKRLHLNQWTQVVERWLDMNDWLDCGHEVDLQALNMAECYMGLDLSSKLDLTALALVFPPQEDDTLWKLHVRCYIPEESMAKRELTERIPYSDWMEQGWVTATPGDVIDYKFIEKDILSYSQEFNVQELAYDPWSAQQTALRVRDDIGIPTVPMRQGFMSLSEPTKEFERLIVSGQLAHGSNECLSWQANNVAVRHDPAGNIKPDKARSQKYKIDGVVASIMALGRATLRESQESIYETEGITVL